MLEAFSLCRHFDTLICQRDCNKNSVLAVDNIFVLIYWYPIVFSALLLSRF